MTAYAHELRRCQVVLLLRAIVEAGGNQCQAARIAGVHRNTVRRILYAAGYDAKSLRRLAQQRKPVRSVGLEAVEDRSAA
jgi:hypothetical protein